MRELFLRLDGSKLFLISVDENSFRKVEHLLKKVPGESRNNGKTIYFLELSDLQKEEG